MDANIDIKQSLRAYQTIVDCGDKQSDGFHYKGLIAAHSFDGYDICIFDDYANLQIFFHNHYKLNATSAVSQQAFLAKIDAVASPKGVKQTHD
ncbi:DUF3081 family protein [Aliikangiella sp. IMCC44632]